MNAIFWPVAFWRAQKMLDSNLKAASDLKLEPCVAVVAGGAVLEFDDQVHVDLDRAHTVLSPDEARRFAFELKRIADMIDPLPDRECGE